MRATLVLFSLALASLSQAQTLFSEDFEGTPAFTLNTADAGSVSGVANTWVVNDVYVGGTGTVDCSGFPLDFTIPATAAQPVEITGPNGKYLHTASLVAIDNSILNCSFGAADGFCTNADDIFARMTTDVSTTGSSDVELKFWWLCNAGNQNYGEVYYSTNAGASWQQVTVPLAQYRNTTNWSEQTVTLPAFGNQATLRFGFRFHNGQSFLGGSDPGFAIDDVRIIASSVNSIVSNLQGAIGYFCQGYMFQLPFTATGTFEPGNVFTAQLSDAVGSFAAPIAIGALAGTGSGTIDCAIPENTPAGTGYLVRVVSDLPAVTGVVGFGVIHVLEAPYAGTNDSLEVCSGAEPFIMDLGGDPGGTWSGPSMVQNATFDPGTMEPGTYNYFLPGAVSCPSSTADLVIALIPGANAGGSTSTVICKNTGIYDLLEFLGGTPDAGGIWTGPGGGPSDGTFNSATANGGIYTYTVDGGGSCGADEAVVSVTLGQPGQAGPDGAWTTCSDALPVDLFDLLDVSANLTGVWFNNGIPFDGVAEAGGDYIYIDYADVPCSNDTAFITLVVSQAAYAGENGTLQVCDNDPPVVLFNALTGGAQAGGTWTGPDGSPHSGTFIPGTDAFGLYSYTVNAAEPCDADESVLAVVLCEVGITEQVVNGTLAWLGCDGDGQQLFSGARMKDARIEVIDASGRLVLRREKTTLNGQVRLDAGGLNPGVYTLVLRGSEDTRMARFVR